MSGSAEKPMTMLSWVLPGQRAPHDHPLRKMNALADGERARLSPL